MDTLKNKPTLLYSDRLLLPIYDDIQWNKRHERSFCMIKYEHSIRMHILVHVYDTDTTLQRHDYNMTCVVL
jgi:hypothetical protein